MILLDANIFMYAAGAPHPNKAPSIRLLESVARRSITAALDAEVLQEILHRYRALNRWEHGKIVYDMARRIVPETLPITADILDAARVMLDSNSSLQARDALHAAVYFEHGATAFCSYDTDFDALANLKRRTPEELLD